jgi:hypothetical protein
MVTPKNMPDLSPAENTTSPVVSRAMGIQKGNGYFSKDRPTEFKLQKMSLGELFCNHHHRLVIGVNTVGSG